jgi:acetylornithine deacetylase/succinyl-diaminopimelate desuccinylase-like protein
MTAAEIQSIAIDFDALKAAAFDGHDSLISMTQALVRVDSQTPPSDTRQVARVAASFLSDLPGVALDLHPSDEPVMNLVARLSGGRPGPRLVLSGHLDTYPIGDRSRWRSDPLGADIADGRLYGRGSADMKGGIAALLLVMRIFAERVGAFPGELVLALAGDEESMGELGTQRLIDTVPEVTGDAVLVADVGSPEIIRCGEKGMIWIDIEAEGKEAHGAHVHRGKNAIDRLSAAVAAIKGLEDTPNDLPDDVAETMAAAEAVSEPLGGAGERDVMGRITVNVGQIEGGISPNLVPAHAIARLDIRLPMGTNVATVEDEIGRRLGTLDGIRSTITRRYEPTWTAPGHTIVRAAVAAAADVLQRPVAANMRVGASDARLWRRAGMPAIVCGLTPHNLGAPDEYLDIDELAQLAAIHALTAARFLAG